MNHPVAFVLRGPDVASAALRRFASHWLDPEWGLMHPQAGDERGCPDAIPLFVSLHHDNRSNGSAGGIGWIPTPAEIQTQGHQDSLMPTARPRKQAAGNTKSMTLETHGASLLYCAMEPQTSTEAGKAEAGKALLHRREMDAAG